MQGGALPGVRVELNPMALNKYGIGLEQVRSVLNNANANVPKGHFSDGFHLWEVGANDQMFKAKDYRPLLVAYRNGAPVRLSDVADVIDSVEDLRNVGYANGKPSVIVTINRQPGANIIDTVDRIRAALPQLKAAIPHSITLNVAQDQTVTIRASVRDVETTLLISVLLVILVVFVFLRSPRTTLIPSVAVPVSLIGTFGVMYLCRLQPGQSLADGADHLHRLRGGRRHRGDRKHHALSGAGHGALCRRLARRARDRFTVLTISISLIAVFIPLLMMGGIVGRLFREFAVTLSVAIAISMVVSLTTTPMMCAHLLKEHTTHGWMYRTSESAFNWIVGVYGRTLARVLRHPAITLGVLGATIALNVYLFIHVPKGFFPQQDNGRLNGTIIADQDTSFQAMEGNLRRMVKIVGEDPAVDTVAGYTGGSGGYGNTLNTARMHIQLKPLAERKVSVYDVIERLRPKLRVIRGSTLYMQANQDVRVGGRNSASLYQFTMRGDNVQDLTKYGPPMLSALRHLRLIADVNTDQQNSGLQAVVQYDRDTAARFGISSQLIDNTLYDAFGQRQVSTMYTSLNQYHVVMEAAPHFWQDPEFLKQIYVYAPAGGTVPLSAISRYASSVAPLAVNHQGLFPAVTISFNLAPGVALGDAVDAIEASGAQRRPARYHPNVLRRHRASLPGFAAQRADPDRRRARHGLHRAGHAV